MNGSGIILRRVTFELNGPFKIEIKNKNEILTKSQGFPSVVQWLKICLPMQGTQVQSLVWEDSGAKCWSKACVPQLLSLCSRAHGLQQDKPPEQREKSLQLQTLCN